MKFGSEADKPVAVLKPFLSDFREPTFVVLQDISTNAIASMNE